MSLPNSNLKLSDALNHFQQFQSRKMSDIAGKNTVSGSIPSGSHKMSDYFGETYMEKVVVDQISGAQNALLSDFGSLPTDRPFFAEYYISSIISSNSTNTAALTLDDMNLHPDTVVNVYIQGEVRGRGGDGGSAVNTSSTQSANNGGDGGDAILVESTSYRVNLFNIGTIAGGGGGGGGAYATSEYNCDKSGCSIQRQSAGGGGGAGEFSGSGGSGGTSNGSSGSTTSGGNGGLALGTYASAAGGSGGDRGRRGDNGSADGNSQEGTGNRGSPGFAIRGTGNLNDLSGNDVYGPTS